MEKKQAGAEDYSEYLIKMCNHLFIVAGCLLLATSNWQQVTAMKNLSGAEYSRHTF